MTAQPEQSVSLMTNPPVKTRVAIGLDIGGTKLSAALLNTKTGIERFEKISTPTDGRAFVSAIIELLQPLMTGDSDVTRPECVGIASAGTVNSETGDIFGSTGNLPALRQIGSLRESLEQQLGVPVFIENFAFPVPPSPFILGEIPKCPPSLFVKLFDSFAQP